MTTLVQTPLWRLETGANLRPDGGTTFRVWAPLQRSMHIQLLTGEGRQLAPMDREPGGFFAARVKGLQAGTRYTYLLDGDKTRADPVSRSLPLGIRGPTELVDPEAFRWSDQAWRGLPAREYVFYEAHVGTFTREGTFAAAALRLPHLKRLGATCLELMPVAQFPGSRNWGYDAVSPYAVQDGYGGPAGLKRLVDACHRRGLAVCLDVVYNHLGPEGNRLPEFGPYFTDRYRTPWGKAVNLDGPGSDQVRRYFIDNALYWVSEYHADALRLDAVHAVYDFGARHFLAELAREVKELARRLGREVLIVAESDLNDPRLVRPPSRGGRGLDAQWSDDFHHAVHVALTGEREGYYRDYSGLGDVCKALTDTFVYDGRYSAFRERGFGDSARDVPGERFVVCLQNHDQVGNRPFGDRLGASVPFESEKAAAAVLLLSPYLPLIFMGQEYRELRPFLYFTDFSDPALAAAVRAGRRRERAGRDGEPPPDPQAPATFLASKLRWDVAEEGEHRSMLRLYQDLLALRRTLGLPGRAGKRQLEASCDESTGWLALRYSASAAGPAAVLASFARGPRVVRLPFPDRRLRVLLDTQDKRYGGRGSMAGSRLAGQVFLRGPCALAGILEPLRGP